MSYVDNSVEIGDFFLFFVAFPTKSSEKLWISWSIKNYVKKVYRFGQWSRLKSFYSYLSKFVLYFSRNQTEISIKIVKRGKENVGL